MKIAIINGPNLNLLGKRETDIYGNKPFDVYFSELQHKYPHIHLHYFQSNVEGELINELQGIGFEYDGLFLTRVDTLIHLLLLAMQLLPLKPRLLKYIFPMYMQEKISESFLMFPDDQQEVFLAWD
jgi:hypothetical protein